jgi:peptidoglycan hydrolase CwlO-like protein
MFGSSTETLTDIAAGTALAVIGYFARHVQIGWKGEKSKKPGISSDLKRQLCQQIKGLEKRVNELQRKNERLQKMIDKLLRENAELKSDNRGLLNSMGVLRAKVEKLACS